MSNEPIDPTCPNCGRGVVATDADGRPWPQCNGCSPAPTECEAAAKILGDYERIGAAWKAWHDVFAANITGDKSPVQVAASDRLYDTLGEVFG